MKSFVISMLFAAAAAQAGYECVNPGDAWTVETLTGDAPTDAATCKTACQAFIDAADTPTDNDWCCAVEIVADPAAVTCGLLSFATAADTEIRAEATAVAGTTFEAWAWAAGVEIEEEVVADDAEDDAEDDEDMSVRMTLSALATASIAMLAM